MAETTSQSKITPVAEDWNWTARIRNELDANKAWQRNWGFLLEQPCRAKPQQPIACNGQMSADPHDALSAFMQSAAPASSSAVPLSYIASKQRDSARARRQMQQQDALDGFVSSYMAKASPMARELPTKEFRKPLTTSHEYGWGRNLEVFGRMTLLLK
ncbi:hypothetical protein VOLCADRAFT_98503 [Volvox carteri f. nagariensis]|uniref:Uncharacterized protein n=1 Tax=Volvox carteri f. nagariensis TaxID=3068 RepID=D8UFI4_VOLCA|nr:uncharacterized protein VOLCADRAFT_98503 [Volvox carteri f. nagariensis]EFJ41463.1 hypothetical protein VOLCADRAFT_98503 [Volvox carteri f. nagariensis]|eukprot:XP_002957408.1 hypothetical protein VOLCADRAFT_98503 [Volvox carteri f. nagariensis]